MSWSKMIDRWQKSKSHHVEVEEATSGKNFSVGSDKIWGTNKKVVEACKESHVGSQVVVTIHPLVVQKVQALSLMHPDTEFLVYLYGSCTCNHSLTRHGEFGKDPCNICNSQEKCSAYTANPSYKEKRYVTDVYIPKQTVTMGSVDMDGDENIPAGLIGALHKHPGDGHTRFSCTDDEKLNINHWISIVIPSTAALKYWYGTAKQQYNCAKKCIQHDAAKLQFTITTPDIKSGSSRIQKGTISVSKTLDLSKYSGKDHACGDCDRTFNSENALQNHQDAKGHKSVKKITYNTDDELDQLMGYGRWD